MNTKTIFKIFREGIESRKNNERLSDCMYGYDSAEEYIWMRGWQYFDKKATNTFGNVDDEIYDNSDDFFLKYGWIKETLQEAIYKGRKVKLNKPMRGDRKRFKVYVNSGKKTKEGEIIAKKVEFGSLKGDKLRVRNYDPKRAKSFAARHKCETANDPTTPRYWSCRAPLAKSKRIW